MCSLLLLLVLLVFWRRLSFARGKEGHYDDPNDDRYIVVTSVGVCRCVLVCEHTYIHTCMFYTIQKFAQLYILRILIKRSNLKNAQESYLKVVCVHY